MRIRIFIQISLLASILFGCQCNPSSESLSGVILDYGTRIHGYSVSIQMNPEKSGESYLLEGPTSFHFKNGRRTFTLKFDEFSLQGFAGIPDSIESIPSKIVLKDYIEKPTELALFDANPFYFADLDFDGKEEIIIVRKLWGPSGTTRYEVYGLDGQARFERPFDEIDSHTLFNVDNKTITLNYYNGIMIGNVELVFKKQEDGKFILTDSTKVLLTTVEDTITDSLRYHYRRIGEQMVLQ